MKKFLTLLVALMLVTGLCLTAFAEGETEEPAAAAVSETVDTAALQEAQAAYRAAKLANEMTAYKAELNAMVEAGLLTQAQADLLLKDAQNRLALQEARNAYRAAKSSNSQTALEAELAAMVEAGQLTQEQADLLLQNNPGTGFGHGHGRMNNGTQGFGTRPGMGRGQGQGRGQGVSQGQERGSRR